MTHPYVAHRPGTANLYYHRIVPAELRPYFDGPAQYWKSLGTPMRKAAYKEAAKESVTFNKKIADAEAKRALAKAAKEAAAFVAATCSSDPAPDTVQATHKPLPPLITGAPEARALDENAVPTLARRYQYCILRADDFERQGMSNDDIVARRAELEYAQEQLSLAGAAERCEHMAESADAMLEAENVTADPSSHAYQLLLKALLDADLNVIAEQVGRLRGRPTSTPKDVPPIPAECDNWPAMLAAWKKRRKPREKTFDETKRLTERFQEINENAPIHEINTEQVEYFKKRLLEDGLSPSRINTILALLRAVVFAAMKEDATTLGHNPFSGVQYSEKVVNSVPPKKPREPFRVDELNVLFSSAVYKDALRPAKGGREAAFWMPLLGLFTGARIEDLGFLTVGDFRNFDGIWYIELGDKKMSKGNTRRSIYRKVPVHPELIRLGLLQYVEMIRAKTNGTLNAFLFPELVVAAYDSRTKVFGSWFNEYIDELGLTDPRLDFHALRATFQDNAELSGLEAVRLDIIDYIVGHQPDMDKMSNRYCRKERGRKAPPFEQLVKAIKKYRIPGLDLSHLYLT